MLLLIFGYFGFLTVLFAGAAKLAARFYGRRQLLWKQALFFGAVAAALFNAGAYAGMGRGGMALVYPFLLLVSWGTGCFHVQLCKSGNDRSGLEDSFILSLSVVGLFVAVTAAIGGLVILVDGPPMSGGG